MPLGHTVPFTGLQRLLHVVTPGMGVCVESTMPIAQIAPCTQS
jgi:hypothetical protein